MILVIGAARSLRREAPPLPPLVLAIVPAVILVLSAIMLFGREAILPPVPGAEAFDPTSGRVLGASPFSTGVVLLQVAIFVGFIVAAILLRRLYVRYGLVSDGYLAAGLVVAAFSQLHFALDPVVASGIVTSTDALRLVFYVILRARHPGRDRWRLHGAPPRQRRAEPAPRGRRRQRHAGRTDTARARDPRRPRPGPVVREAQAGPPDPEREPRRRGEDDRRRGPQRHRFGAGRGAPGGHGDARRPVGGIEPRGGPALVRRGLLRPLRRARRVRGRGHAPAAAATDRGGGPAHRPGGAQQRPPARRRHASSGSGPSGADRSRASRSPTMGAGSTRRRCRRRATACAGCASAPSSSGRPWTSGRDPRTGRGSASKSRPRRQPRA